jgi:hypothetical protein
VLDKHHVTSHTGGFVKKTGLFLALLLFATTAFVARADTVSYSTNWDPSIDPTTQSFFNTTTLAFQGTTQTVNAPTTSSLLGYFSVTSLWGGTETFRDVPFDLVVTQAIPAADPNSGSFSSTLSGKLSWDYSTLGISFDNPSIQIGNVVYTLAQQNYQINPNDNWSAGQTEIDAAISMAAPEPTTLLLFGSGLAFLAFVLRRRVLSGNVPSCGIQAS